MLDITYCKNSQCPFEDCERHLKNMPKDAQYVSVASFDGICRDYIGYLVDEIGGGEDG